MMTPDRRTDEIEAQLEALPPSAWDFDLSDNDTDDPSVPRYWSWELHDGENVLLGGQELDDPSALLRFIAGAPEAIRYLVATKSMVIRPLRVLVMEDHVREMHTASGLLTDVHDGNLAIGHAEAQTQVCQFLGQYFGTEKPVLGGSTVNFDRKWLERYMPALMRGLHYRNVDVSTLKTLAKVWDAETAAAWAEIEGQHEKFHRAMPDILQTLAELRFYRDSLRFDARVTPTAVVAA